MTTGTPQWVRSSLRIQDGRDPLGLQTTTQDRLTPVLLPGLLELSNRARYFSFHLFLLSEYRRRKLPMDRRAFSQFVKRREYEFGLAVRLCEHCDTSPVGSQRVRPAVAASPDMYERGESVKSDLGGYGLYYRSPLIAFGAVWPAGTELVSTDQSLPIDVVDDHEAVREVAESFAEAVGQTRYITQYFLTDDPIPSSVLQEYATVACLCRLSEHLRERTALRRLLLTPLHESMSDEVEWRRRAVAHYLTIVDADATTVEDEHRFRTHLWAPPVVLSEVHRAVADRWAALVAKDVVQDALCSIWTAFLEHGRASAGWDPIAGSDLRLIVDAMCNDPELGLHQDARWADVDRKDGVDLEALRAWTEARSDATSGLLAFDAAMTAVAGRSGPGWLATARIGSAWQPSLVDMQHRWAAHLATRPTVSDSLWWVVRHHVISVHERIAYSKMPEFTFRFRSEPAGLRFFNLWPGRFILAAIRHRPLGLLTGDLGYWSGDGEPSLTSDGRSLVAEVLS